MKSDNDDGGRIAANSSGTGTNVQTSIDNQGCNPSKFYFTAHRFGTPSGDSNQNYSPRFYFRRESGDHMNVVKWDDDPDNRHPKLTWEFTVTVKGHQPVVQNLAGSQINTTQVRLNLNGYDRKGDTVSWPVRQYRLGAGGTWTKVSIASTSSISFSSGAPAINFVWNAKNDIGAQQAIQDRTGRQARRNHAPLPRPERRHRLRGSHSDR